MHWIFMKCTNLLDKEYEYRYCLFFVIDFQSLFHFVFFCHLCMNTNYLFCNSAWLWHNVQASCWKTLMADLFYETFHRYRMFDIYICYMVNCTSAVILERCSKCCRYRTTCFSPRIVALYISLSMWSCDFNDMCLLQGSSAV